MKHRGPKHVSRRAVLGGALGGALLPVGARPARAAGLPPADFSRGMHVVITGAGAAFPVPERGNAGAAVVVDGTVVQFDCARRTMDNLLIAGINPLKVDHIGFTHLHFDHIGEFGYFAVCAWIGGRLTPIDVFGPTGTVDMARGMIFNGHHTDVSFVTRRVQGQGGAPMKSSAEPPVRARDVRPGTVLETPRLKVTAVATPHIPFVGPNRSLAYRVDSAYGSVVISGDTAPSDDVVALAKDVDLLIHECTMPPAGVASGGSFSKPWDRSTPSASTGHTSPAQLGVLAQKANAKKLVATHFGVYSQYPAAIEMAANYFGPEGVGPDVWTAIVAEIKRGYGGPVVLAEDALVLRVGAAAKSGVSA